MKTSHKIFFGNSNNMKEVQPESINLVVTSPPYPMIEMWDEQFSTVNYSGLPALSSLLLKKNKIDKKAHTFGKKEIFGSRIFGMA